MKIGNNIRKLRELNNLTQDFVAHSLSLSTAGYGKIERNEVDITVSRLSDLAMLLKVSPEYLLNFDEKKFLSLTNSNYANGDGNQQTIVPSTEFQEFLKKENILIEKMTELIDTLKKK